MGTAFAGFKHQQFRNVTLHLNNITSWQIEEWITELDVATDPRLYEKRISFSAYRVAAVVDIDVAVSPDPGTPAVIAIAGGLNAGDTITVNGNDTSGGGSVAFPEVVYVAQTTSSEAAAFNLAGQIASAWGIDISTLVSGTEYDAIISITNLDSLEITGAAYVSNLPVIPADAG